MSKLLKLAMEKAEKLSFVSFPLEPEEDAMIALYFEVKSLKAENQKMKDQFIKARKHIQTERQVAQEAKNKAEAERDALKKELGTSKFKSDEYYESAKRGHERNIELEAKLAESEKAREKMSRRRNNLQQAKDKVPNLEEKIKTTKEESEELLALNATLREALEKIQPHHSGMCVNVKTDKIECAHPDDPHCNAKTILSQSL